jgi:ribosomal protein S18 acetylase RimI-like enzyme
MKLTLRRKPDTPSPECGVPRVRIKKLNNEAVIQSYLETKRNYAVTAFAHLEPGYPDISRWLLATEQDRFALCLIAKGMFPNYIFTMGDTKLLDAILQSTNLPGRTYITFQPEHLRTIEDYYELEWHLSVQRMVVTRGSFRAAEQTATRLRSIDSHELNRLYDLERSGNFTTSQIRRGVFYGIWRDGQLAAVAGTHLVAPTYGLAYVGNVLTHPAYRNQGLATICASSVTAELLRNCTEVVLNVESHNLPAVRAYANLGYVDDCRILEAIGHRKNFVGVIINSVCRKLGLIPKYEQGMEPDG